MGKPGVAGVYMNQRLNLSKPWEGPRRTCQGLELGSGNPTVQDFRGASGTVRQGENVNPSCSRKSRHGNPSPTARRARFLSQPESPEPRDMGVQVPCRVHAEVPQEVAVWANQAALGKCIPRACQRKECRIEEGHLMPDHVHMLISIPPKYSVSEVIGYPKGKSSIWIAQNVERKLRNFLGHKFWARGYFVSTIGRDEEMIRAYIRNQEMADKQLDQLQLKLASS